MIWRIQSLPTGFLEARLHEKDEGKTTRRRHRVYHAGRDPSDRGSLPRAGLRLVHADLGLRVVAAE